MPIVMSLEEAKREVMAWTLPEGKPQLVRAAIVSISDALPLLLEGESPSTWSRWGYDEQLTLEGGTLAERDAPHIDLSSWSPEFPGPLILIQTSHLGMNLYPEELAGNADSQDSWRLMPRSHRYSFTSFFDASDGQHLGFTFEDLPEAVWDLAEAKPMLTVLRTATPIQSPTPSSTSTPLTSHISIATATGRAIRNDSVRATATARSAADVLRNTSERLPLVDGQLPPSLHPVADVWPLVPAARWTYRVTGVVNGAKWWSATFTETVESAFRRADDIVELRLACTDTRGSDCYYKDPWSTGMDYGGDVHLRLLLTPKGVANPFRFHDDPPTVDELLSSLDLLWSGRRQWEAGDPIEVLRVPLSRMEHYNHLWSVGDPRAIDTPAGKFDDCYPLYERVGHEYWTHWLCPGVGFVRHAMGGGNSAGGFFTVYELLDYVVPVAP